jgi:hypothetical protein
VVGPTKNKDGAAGFVEAAFCFLMGEEPQQWSMAPLSHCSREQFFFYFKKPVRVN